MTTWVDLGDGTAIDASRVGSIELCPPWNPFRLLDSPHRIFPEQWCWWVRILDARSSILYTVGFYLAVDDARAHARRIVALMLDAAES